MKANTKVATKSATHSGEYVVSAWYVLDGNHITASQSTGEDTSFSVGVEAGT